MTRAGAAGLISMVWSLSAAAAPAEKADAAGSAMADAIAARYAFAKVKKSAISIHLSAFGYGCEPFKTVGPTISVLVRSPNQQVFANVGVYVERLAGGGTGYAQFAAMIKGVKPSDEACGASKAPVAYIESRNQWITVLGQCRDGALFRYEVGEVLQGLGSDAPTTFLLGSCGGDFPDVTETAPFLTDLQKPHTFWGKTFPAAREAMRRK
jgi:hypothetical protein